MLATVSYSNPHSQIQLDTELRAFEYNTSYYDTLNKVADYAYAALALISLVLSLVYIPTMAPVTFTAAILFYPAFYEMYTESYEHLAIESKEDARITRGIQDAATGSTPRDLLEAQKKFWENEGRRLTDEQRVKRDALPKHEDTDSYLDLATIQQETRNFAVFSIESAYRFRAIEEAKIKSAFFDFLLQNPAYTKSLEETLEFVEGPLFQKNGLIAIFKEHREVRSAIYAEINTADLSGKFNQLVEIV